MELEKFTMTPTQGNSQGDCCFHLEVMLKTGFIFEADVSSDTHVLKYAEIKDLDKILRNEQIDAQTRGRYHFQQDSESIVLIVTVEFQKSRMTQVASESAEIVLKRVNAEYNVRKLNEIRLAKAHTSTKLSNKRARVDREQNTECTLGILAAGADDNTIRSTEWTDETENQLRREVETLKTENESLALKNEELKTRIQELEKVNTKNYKWINVTKLIEKEHGLIN